MKKITIAILALCGCLLMASCNQAADKSEGFVIKRGTNLSHWLSQSRVVGEERAQRVTEADIARIANLGFDHVRIPIDESQFWDNDGNKLQDAWDLLTNALETVGQCDATSLCSVDGSRKCLIRVDGLEDGLYDNA